MLSASQHRRLCRARQRLREAGTISWPLEQIAAEAGFSRYHFIRRFTAVFGVTPHQYRQRHRLELAREMLLLGSEPVTEICLSVGFSSLGSFSTLFKRQFGVPPSRFRQRATGTASAQHQPGCLTLMQRALQAQQQFSRSTG